jgi:hypothetical protein
MESGGVDAYANDDCCPLCNGGRTRWTPSNEFDLLERYLIPLLYTDSVLDYLLLIYTQELYDAAYADVFHPSDAVADWSSC